METITAEGLAAITGTVLAVCFAYIPGLRTWFATFSSEARSGIMALLLIVVSGLIMASSCANLWLYMDCSKDGILSFLEVVAYALVLNQSTYTILPETKDTKQAKATRTTN